MATWPEARAAKETRLARERVHFTPDLAGPRCPRCNGKTSAKLVKALGTPIHPTCHPADRALLHPPVPVT